MYELAPVYLDDEERDEDEKKLFGMHYPYMAHLLGPELNENLGMVRQLACTQHEKPNLSFGKRLERVAPNEMPTKNEDNDVHFDLVADEDYMQRGLYQNILRKLMEVLFAVDDYLQKGQQSGHVQRVLRDMPAPVLQGMDIDLADDRRCKAIDVNEFVFLQAVFDERHAPWVLTDGTELSREKCAELCENINTAIIKVREEMLAIVKRIQACS